MKTYGKTASDKPITDQLVAKLAAEAEAGYDVEAILRRRGEARARRLSGRAQTEKS